LEPLVVIVVALQAILTLRVGIGAGTALALSGNAIVGFGIRIVLAVKIFAASRVPIIAWTSEAAGIGTDILVTHQGSSTTSGYGTRAGFAAAGELQTLRCLGAKVDLAESITATFQVGDTIVPVAQRTGDGVVATF